MKALQYLLDTVRKMRELEMIELRDGDDNRRTALMYAALYVYPGTARFGLYPRLFIASHCTSFNGWWTDPGPFADCCAGSQECCHELLYAGAKLHTKDEKCGFGFGLLYALFLRVSFGLFDCFASAEA